MHYVLQQLFRADDDIADAGRLGEDAQRWTIIPPNASSKHFPTLLCQTSLRIPLSNGRSFGIINLSLPSHSPLDLCTGNVRAYAGQIIVVSNVYA